jgi:elongation factor P
MQGSPAAFPLGIPGIGEVMEGAVQHAPQPDRHCIINNLAWNESV